MSFQKYTYYRDIGIDQDQIKNGYKISWSSSLYSIIHHTYGLDKTITVPKAEPNGSGYSYTNHYCRMYGGTLLNMVKEFAYQAICRAITEKYRGNIFDYVNDQVLLYDLCVYSYQVQRHNYRFYQHPDEKEFYNDINESFAVIKHEDYTAEPQGNMVEHIKKFGEEDTPLHVSSLDKNFTDIVKRIISSKFTYCFKRGVLQIPDEECPEDIEEVAKAVEAFQNRQEHKAVGIEQQIARTTVKKRKDFAYSTLRDIDEKLCKLAFTSWSDHYFYIENRYNKTNTKKFINKLLFRKPDGKLKSNTDILKMSDKEIRNTLCDNYEAQLKQMIYMLELIKGE